MEAIEPRYVVYAFAAVCGILIAEAVYLLLAGKSERRAGINRRIRLRGQAVSQEQVLLQLRKERGIAGDGPRLSMESLARLKMQSGLRMPLGQLFALCAAAGLLAGLALWLKAGLALALLLAPLVGSTALPVWVLALLRKRRHKRFGLQLPEALDLVVRGLKAGHPVPVAIAMVGREMPDPIGSEFGMVADEVTYGSDMVSALRGLNERVGHEDLPLFVTAVAIQSSTGGNLREILQGLAETIRSRVKLRRKIRAISTEGRLSAYILTAVPGLLAAAVFAIMPDYYDNVLDETLTWYLIGLALAMLTIGNVVMFRMANFRF